LNPDSRNCDRVKWGILTWPQVEEFEVAIGDDSGVPQMRRYNARTPGEKRTAFGQQVLGLCELPSMQGNPGYRNDQRKQSNGMNKHWGENEEDPTIHRNDLSPPIVVDQDLPGCVFNVRHDALGGHPSAHSYAKNIALWLFLHMIGYDFLGPISR
jgi:hypothetical protein